LLSSDHIADRSKIVIEWSYSRQVQNCYLVIV